MAGQGLNLGMADAAGLADAILDGVCSGTDLGSVTILDRYEQKRKGEALLMMGMLETLHHLFGHDGRGVSALRNAGLTALNALGPLKDLITQRSMRGSSKY
ncbi:unnamed protein product [Choristocarpus tenellus]